MDKTVLETPRQAPIRKAHIRKEGEGALVWLAFIALAVIAIAAVTAFAIRHTFQQVLPAAVAPGLSRAQPPSPGPPPLPKPGIAPRGAGS